MHRNVQNEGLVCKRCGQAHRFLRPQVGQRSACATCGANLDQPSRFISPHALPALATGAMILAIPTGVLPVVTLSRLGVEHSPPLASGLDGLVTGGFTLLAALVGASAMVGPVALAALLAAWWWLRERKYLRAATRLERALEFIEYWAMPEVYVLGVLIAFVKLGDLVHVVARSGLWCYAGMAVLVLAAWRTYIMHFRPAPQVMHGDRE